MSKFKYNFKNNDHQISLYQIIYLFQEKKKNNRKKKSKMNVKLNISFG